MASDYGLNFGFRRSDESMRISEGRLRTPVGSSLQLGTAAELDPDNPGYLRVAANNAVPRPGICGLLLQEEIWDRSIYENQLVDSFHLGIAYPDRLSVITNGDGVKVWMRNTEGQTRADGRVIPSVTMFVASGLAVGEQIGWNGTAWAHVTGGLTNAFAEITDYNASRGYLEAVLLA